MACTCGSNSIVRVNAKCDDRAVVGIGEHERNGYVPYNLGIGGGDYVKFKFCTNCGRLQGFKPLSENGAIEAILGDEFNENE